MDCVIGLTSLALLAGVVVTWCVARGKRWRWGRTVETGPSVGEGTYRSAPVSVERPRGIPVVCMLGSVTAVAWGLLTSFIFAPAGALWFLFGLGDITQEGWCFALGTVGLLVAAIRGSMVGPRLTGAVHFLAVRTTDSAEAAARMARQSLFHHALVAAVLGLLYFGVEGELIVFAMCAIPCSIGFAQAALLLGARATLARLDREDAALAASNSLTAGRQ